MRNTYKDDILDVSMQGRRRYEIIENTDGTVTLIDRTTYTQVGDDLSADVINEISTNLTPISQSEYDSLGGGRESRLYFTYDDSEEE